MTTQIKIAAIRLLQLFFFLVPIKKNRIMFYANNRKGYVCNPAALMNTLRHKYPGEYDLIWVSRFPESCEPREEITIVKQRSLSYYRYFTRTKYVITNDMIDETLIKKPGQLFITTWHGGGAYKKVGTSALSEDKAFAHNFYRWYGRLDYFVSSCRICTEMYADAFGLKKQCFLETGTPRNDIFFEDHSEIPTRVRSFYGLSEQTRILLFAPSFQMTAPDKEHYDRKQLQETATALTERTSDPWVILYRSHYLRDEEPASGESQIYDGNAYYEMQDLLYTADILVTDFSSCIWDFSLTGRPIILLGRRLQEYEREDRGFFIPYESWPYLSVNKLSELTDIISDHLDQDFSTVYKKHWKDMGSFENGNACNKIINTVIRGEKQ